MKRCLTLLLLLFAPLQFGFASGANLFINVAADFGADNTGTRDSTAAIQNAIWSIPHGGTIYFPAGTYYISSTIYIGNGSASGSSTINGIVLAGAGAGGMAGFSPSYVTTSDVVVKWTGSGTGSMINILGPIHGWGIHDIAFDGNDQAQVGLYVLAGEGGNCSNLAFQHLHLGIYLGAVVVSNPTYQGEGDSLHNYFQGTTVQVPLTNGSMGIYFAGTGTGSSISNSCYNQFVNTTIMMTWGTPAGGHNYALRFGLCDSNSFNNLHVIPAPATIGVLFDFTQNPIFPCGNMFYQVDCPNWVCQGIPSSIPNYIYGFSTANGAEPPSIPNLIVK
jgi:Pectate lyase superfamily protein